MEELECHRRTLSDCCIDCQVHVSVVVCGIVGSVVGGVAHFCYCGDDSIVVAVALND